MVDARLYSRRPLKDTTADGRSRVDHTTRGLKEDRSVQVSDHVAAIAAFQTPDNEVPLSDLLKVGHEHHVYRRSAQGAYHR